MGGAFTLSDDSHSITQVGTHYVQALADIERFGIEKLACLAEVSGEDHDHVRPLDDERFSHVGWTYVSVEGIRRQSRWRGERA
jgi:hypothetical protein